LCTSPDKDIGFPHKSCFGRAVDEGTHRLSWRGYLIHQQRLAAWEDARHPRPSHREWADYLKWVADFVKMSTINGLADSARVERDHWIVRYYAKGERKKRYLPACGIVLTGTGEPRRLTAQSSDYRICDGKSFWFPNVRPEFNHLRNARILIVGGGDTAGTIAAELLKLIDPRSSRVVMMTHSGKLRMRGEDPETNKHFSDPSDWLNLGERERTAFITGSDRGVLGRALYFRLEAAKRRGALELVAGRAEVATVIGGSVSVQITGQPPQEYDRVVVAIGFETTWLQGLDRELRMRLDLPSKKRALIKRISKRIGDDLSVEGMQPKLHLPMLAAFCQGPGFPNLTCLGVLSDRILRAYVSPNAMAG
jgi:mycobactin lysine-N-oxygenase